MRHCIWDTYLRQTLTVQESTLTYAAYMHGDIDILEPDAILKSIVPYRFKCVGIRE